MFYSQIFDQQNFVSKHFIKLISYDYVVISTYLLILYYKFYKQFCALNCFICFAFVFFSKCQKLLIILFYLVMNVKCSDFEDEITVLNVSVRKSKIFKLLQNYFQLFDDDELVKQFCLKKQTVEKVLNKIVNR